MPPSERNTLRRQVSYTSIGLAQGAFPTKCHVTSPTINGAAYTTAVPSLNAIVKDIITPLLKYERLSHVMDVKKGVFVPVAAPYDPADLVRQIDVEAATPQDLHNIILSHAQDALQEGRNGLPWWEVLVLKNAKSPAQSSALVLRIHHALGDGLSLLHVFREILTTTEGTAPWPLDAVSVRHNRSRPKYSWWSFLAALGKVLSLPTSRYDTNTAFSKHNHPKMVHSGHRQICVFPNVPLEFCKALKTKAEVSLNDVLLAALSQAIHDYCRAQENATTMTTEGAATNNRDKMVPVDSKTQCRVLMPVGLPPADPVNNPLTNRWCMVSCDLGVGQSDIRTRLDAIVQNTQRLKELPVAGVQLAVQNRVMRWLPLSLGRKTCFDVFSRHSLVITNVPGPSEPCQLAGQAVNDLQLIYDNILTQINLISYAGTVYGNIIYDPEALPGLSDIFGRCYAQALVDLAQTLDVPVPKDFVVD